MRLMKKLWAAMTGEVLIAVDGGPATEAEETAWQEYHSGWEMDLPPPPRAVFLAGFRAQKRGVSTAIEPPQ